MEAQENSPGLQTTGGPVKAAGPTPSVTGFLGGSVGGGTFTQLQTRNQANEDDLMKAAFSLGPQQMFSLGTSASE